MGWRPWSGAWSSLRKPPAGRRQPENLPLNLRWGQLHPEPPVSLPERWGVRVGGGGNHRREEQRPGQPARSCVTLSCKHGSQASASTLSWSRPAGPPGPTLSCTAMTVSPHHPPTSPLPLPPLQHEDNTPFQALRCQPDGVAQRKGLERCWQTRCSVLVMVLVFL